MSNKRGEQGVGVLIIVIAMLLVAAVAAGMIIYNSGELQEDSMDTATSARRQVTTGVDLIDLSAMDGSDGDVEDFRYLIKLNPGAEPVNLKNAVLYVNTHNETIRLTYKDGACMRDPVNGYYTVK